MTTDDEGETATQGELQFETCRCEPRSDPEQQAHDVALTTPGIQQALHAMTDFGICDELSASDDNDDYLADEVPRRRYLACG